MPSSRQSASSASLSESSPTAVARITSIVGDTRVSGRRRGSTRRRRTPAESSPVGSSSSSTSGSPTTRTRVTTDASGARSRRRQRALRDRIPRCVADERRRTDPAPADREDVLERQIGGRRSSVDPSGRKEAHDGAIAAESRDSAATPPDASRAGRTSPRRTPASTTRISSVTVATPGTNGIGTDRRTAARRSIRGSPRTPRRRPTHVVQLSVRHDGAGADDRARRPPNARPRSRHIAPGVRSAISITGMPCPTRTRASSIACAASSTSTSGSTRCGPSSSASVIGVAARHVR